MSIVELIDTHCHLNFFTYNDDRTEVVQRALAVGVKQIIIPAIDLETCQEALDLSREFEGIYVAVGFHPNSTSNFSDDDLTAIKDFSTQEKVIAIGEIGLDYYWDKSPKDAQRKAFEQQLELARSLELPVIIHNREASEDVIEVLESWAKSLPDSLKDRPGVLHSFSAPPEIAERALAIGFYLGFTGPITFKKADDVRANASIVPIDRLLIETDAPFLTPHPYRGKRNEPAYVEYVAKQLAQVKNLSYEEIAHHTTSNARRLFRL